MWVKEEAPRKAENMVTSENKNITYQNLWNAKFSLISRAESSHSVVQQLGGGGSGPTGTVAAQPLVWGSRKCCLREVQSSRFSVLSEP